MPYIGYSSFYRMNPKIETARSEKKKKRFKKPYVLVKKKPRKMGTEGDGEELVKNRQIVNIGYAKINSKRHEHDGQYTDVS